MSRTVSPRRARAARSVAPALALLLLATPASAQFSTVNFTESAVTVSEADGSVTLTVVIDGPGNFGGTGVRTLDGTAVAGSDYVSLSDFLYWPGGDSSPKQVTVDLVADGSAEGPEEFLVELFNADGVTIGSPSTVTVTVVEDGSQPEAYFLLDEGIEASPLGGYYVPVESGIDFLVPLRLRDFPTTPKTVQYLVGDDPTVHEAVFDGIQEQVVAIPGAPAPEGAPVAIRHVRVAGVRRDRGESTLGLAEFFAGTSGFTNDDECSYCAWNLLMAFFGFTDCDVGCAIDYASDCPLESPATAPAEPAADLLRQYRDNVLATTTGGQFYVDFYGDVSGEIARAMMRSPRIAYDIWNARDAWIDGISALVGGGGDGFVITADMQADLLDIVAKLRQAGDPSLDQKLALESARIGLDSIAGKNMVEFQGDVEAAGASVSIEPASWGAVKARYRR